MTTPANFNDQMEAAFGDRRQVSAPPPSYQGSGPWNNTYVPKPDVLLEIMEPDGTLYRTFTLPTTYSEWFPLARKHYPEGTTVSSVAIPKDRCKFTYDTPKFNGCTFDATDSYLGARWGRKLHYSDRTWLSLHPFATDDGIPTEYTLICLQQLMEPYGMGISAVRMRKGSLAASKHVMQFATALGCNPIGLFDHQTSNADAAKALDITDEKAKQLWRFEFADEPLPGCTIVCERGVTAQAGANGFSTGYAGGHARYLAPRDRYGNWVLSLQFAPIEQLTYDTPVVFPEYVERRGDEQLDLGSVLRPEGDTPVAVKVNNWYKDPDEIAAAAEEERARKGNGFYSKSGPTPYPRQGQSAGKGATSPVEQVLCTLCTTPKPAFAMERNATCCFDCYAAAWDGYKCPSCHTKFNASNLPELKTRAETVGFTTFDCPKPGCTTVIQVFDSDEKKTPDLVAMAKTLGKTPTPSSNK